MNVKTETRESNSSETLGSGHPAQQSATVPQDHGGRRTNHRRRGSWLALVAAVACAGLATAVAIEASDGSSNADTVPVVSSYDPQQAEQDRDFHREPPQPSSGEPQPADWDRDFHRDPSQPEQPYGSGLPHEAH